MTVDIQAMADNAAEVANMHLTKKYGEELDADEVDEIRETIQAILEARNGL